VRHEDLGLRHAVLAIHVPKSKCVSCGRYSRQPLPGILRCQRASEAFQKAIYQQHLDGINRSRLGRREGIGAATVERYFRHGLQRQFREWHPPCCPKLLGIDEHFFTRRKGYATTFCDLRHHKVYDVALGRSEADLEAYLARLDGKPEVQLVCIDLASTYRALIRKHFPNARIVADRFHVIRIINHLRGSARRAPLPAAPESAPGQGRTAHRNPRKTDSGWFPELPRPWGIGRCTGRTCGSTAGECPRRSGPAV
jgi:transposase